MLLLLACTTQVPLGPIEIAPASVGTPLTLVVVDDRAHTRLGHSSGLGGRRALVNTGQPLPDLLGVWLEENLESHGYVCFDQPADDRPEVNLVLENFRVDGKKVRSGGTVMWETFDLSLAMRIEAYESGASAPGQRYRVDYATSWMLDSELLTVEDYLLFTLEELSERTTQLIQGDTFQEITR